MEKLPRRLAAVFCADIKDYSQRMSHAEDATYRRLIECRAIIDHLITAHGGRIANTAGDSVVAEFASVVDVVTCAVNIQKQLVEHHANRPADESLTYRIGINLGDVISKGDDILGDGVNVAARIEGIADAGGICVSGSVYDSVKNKLPYRFEFLGDTQLKNIADPVRVYKLLLGEPAPDSSGPAAAPTRPSKTVKPSTKRRAGKIDSLAVLPLENASGDPKAEYLSDGIAETLINSLAQLRKIRVVPRTLAFGYRGPGIQALAVGRELGVRAVLTGRMVQRRNELTVSVELVDVDRQAQLWGGRYNRKMTDLIALQEELTTEISGKLRLQLTGEEMKKLCKRPTQNNEAFRLVLQSQHYLSGVSPEGVLKGIALCERAVAIDPDYAAAYAQLSFGYGIQNIYGYSDPAEVSPRMTAAAKKALELDDTLADAHASLALSLLYRWDLAGAECEARRSADLNPDCTLGWTHLNQILLAQGKFDEAIAAGKRAVGLAPLDYWSSFVLGVTFFHTRQFAKAIEQLCKTVNLDPGSPVAYGPLAQSYASAGQRENAIKKCELALALNRRDNLVILGAAAAYAMLHEAGEARRLVEKVERDWKPDGVSAFWLASVHACLGDKEQAFECLEKAYQEHAPFLCYLKIMWTHEGLHGDSRFDSLLNRIGIPQ